MALKNQKQAADLSFVGALVVTALVVDTKKLTFEASIRADDGVNPAVTFTPCSDDGIAKKFSNIDDILTWLKGAFFDMTQVNISVDMSLITKHFVPPTNVITNAQKQKAAFAKLSTGINDNLQNITAIVAGDIAAGYDQPTAHPALQAMYAADVARKAVVQSIKDFYDAKVTYWTGIGG